MNTKPHCTLDRPVVVLATAAMVLVGGCSVPTVQQYPTSTSSSAPRPTLKYSLDAFTTCVEIQQKVPDLPLPLAPQVSKSATRFVSTCEFTTSTGTGPYITFQAQAFGNEEDSVGFHSGAELAKTAFGAPSSSGTEKETKINLGSEARWPDRGVGVGCKLEVLDENAVMMFTYSSGKKDNDARSEQCRESAREVTRKIFAAVQPG
ncbi:hypothetical protein GCM10022267_74290 [Lentzea roselyniae]|uniref:DUF3558 domain-containing protein n=2 Tax=Lentzea roselyniae TaxID=531940 RepID=A0ABP7C1F1_9PSEU